MNRWEQLADEQALQSTVSALQKNGIGAVVVENRKEARDTVLGMLPPGAEVMTMTSVTLEAAGLAADIEDSGKFVSVRKKLVSMKRETQNLEMQRLGAAPEWVIGSVQAVSWDGKIFVASNTGSQLPAYAYGSPHVIWVVGTQKIVKDTDEAMKRIEEYALPLESERARKAYKISGSAVNKILIINREIRAGRMSMILVKERLGF
jgi:hypothetical protein